MKLEPVAWMDDFGNAFPLAANKGAGSWRDEHKRNWKPLYAIPEGYVMVSAEHVLSKSELTQIDLWRDSAQDRYCYDPPKSEIDLQTKLEAMIAAKEQS